MRLLALALIIRKVDLLQLRPPPIPIFSLESITLSNEHWSEKLAPPAQNHSLWMKTHHF